MFVTSSGHEVGYSCVKISAMKQFSPTFFLSFSLLETAEHSDVRRLHCSGEADLCFQPRAGLECHPDCDLVRLVTLKRV